MEAYPIISRYNKKLIKQHFHTFTDMSLNSIQAKNNSFRAFSSQPQKVITITVGDDSSNSIQSQDAIAQNQQQSLVQTNQTPNNQQVQNSQELYLQQYQQALLTNALILQDLVSQKNYSQFTRHHRKKDFISFLVLIGSTLGLGFISHAAGRNVLARYAGSFEKFKSNHPEMNNQVIENFQNFINHHASSLNLKLGDSPEKNRLRVALVELPNGKTGLAILKDIIGGQAFLHEFYVQMSDSQAIHQPNQKHMVIAEKAILREREESSIDASNLDRQNLENPGEQAPHSYQRSIAIIQDGQIAFMPYDGSIFRVKGNPVFIDQNWNISGGNFFSTIGSGFQDMWRMLLGKPTILDEQISLSGVNKNTIFAHPVDQSYRDKFNNRQISNNLNLGSSNFLDLLLSFEIAGMFSRMFKW
ncbi:MAG: hypothetical protein SFT81_05970 [Candidatus Caenarcaniphilales bacterium]|nr:hypothetical protein [Candidatus Caenarcaniphilales bacterium]